MNVSSLLPMIVSGGIAQLPLILVCLLGIGVSLVRRRAFPAASGWVGAASVVFLFTCIGAPVTQALIVGYVQHQGMTAAKAGIYIGGLSFFWSTLRAASLGLFLAGVYSGRVPAANGVIFPPR